ncbi:hypothetical protein ACPC54_18785 [Kitasatospora sp. NPDC094028]
MTGHGRPEQLELTPPGAAGWCQRWNRRQPTWLRTSDGGFDPALHRCVPLEQGPASSFVREHHYSGSWPAVRMSFGLQRLDEEPGPGEPPGGRLLGVLALGIPMNEAVLTTVFDDLVPYRESLELSRLVLLDRAESNAESWFCARAFDRAARLGVRGVLAHSDPYPRVRSTPDGPQQLSPGHVGHVYAVQGFDYLGRTRPRRLTVLPDATVLNDRAAAKVRQDEPGGRGVARRLVSFGARPRAAGEDGAAWLAGALAEIGATTLHHGGNHRYARTIGPRRTRIRMAATTYPPPRRPER